VRRFSRFYTRQLGPLDEGLLNSAFSLTEARVLYELATRPTLTATELCRDLGIDPGYLGRVLKEFERRGFVTRAPSPGDGRLALLQLTNSGRAAFAPLDEASRHQILVMIRHLMPAEAARLVQAMQTIEHLMREIGVVPGPHHPAAAPGRRYWLDRSSAGRAVCTGVWLGRNL
jgi:DNA-binding MarR family transcriptional regulator